MSDEPGIWLTPDEVQQLTEKKRWTAQCRMLAHMGVPFKPNAVGRPLVERATVLRHQNTNKKPAKGPHWDAIRGKAA